MDHNPLRQGVLTEQFVSIGPDTRAKLHLRAHALAAVAGYVEPLVTQAHFEQAKREVLVEPLQLRPQAHHHSVLEASRS